LTCRRCRDDAGSPLSPETAVPRIRDWKTPCRRVFNNDVAGGPLCEPNSHRPSDQIRAILCLLLDFGCVDVESPPRLLQPPFRKEVCFSGVWSRLTITKIRRNGWYVRVPFELSSPALMYGFGRGVTKIRPNSYAHARITDSLMPYGVHKESLILLPPCPPWLPSRD
jgi:hypothetical protein